MIKVIKSFRRDDMLFTISTSINKKMANINGEADEEKIEAGLVDRIKSLEKNIDSESRLLKFKDYLMNCVFKHFVDVVAINDYVDEVVDLIKKATKSMDHKGLLLLFCYEEGN
jgi:hypothetical protein